MDPKTIRWRTVGTQGLAAIALGVLEICLGTSAPKIALVWAAGLALVVGVLAGAALAGALALLGAAPVLGRWALALLGIAVAVALSDYMGIMGALAGPAHTLALASLLLTTFGSFSLGVLVMTLAGTSTHPHGWLEHRARAVSGPLLMVGCVVFVAAHRFVPSYYRAAQVVGACAGAVVVGIALQAVLGARRLPGRLRRICGLTALLLFAAPVGLGRPSDAVLIALDGAPLSRTGLAALRRATDVDGDGYSALFGGADCDAWNARVHPGAREIPANGVDDNCVFGDAPAPRTSRRREPPALVSPSPTSVILLTIDTLRRDRVGVYGASPSRTPNLDVWASTARRFERAYAASTRTCSSVASLLYGAYPFELGWGEPAASSALKRLQERLPGAMLHVPWMCFVDDASLQGRRPVAAQLRSRGMATAAVVDDSLTFLLQRELYGEGFEQYDDVEQPSDEHSVTAPPTDERAVARAISRLDALAEGERRFFLWVHVFGPHDRGPPARDRDVAAEYDSEVSRTDRALAPLFAAMEAVSRRTPLAAIVASDHGELLGPRRRWHGTDLSEDLLNVPLLVRAPGLPPGRSAALVSTVDVLPTCLALTRTFMPDGLTGIDLTADEGILSRGRTLFSDVWNEKIGYAFTAAYDGRDKLVYNHFLGTHELSSQGGTANSIGASALRAKLDRYLHDNELHLTN